MKNSKMKLYTIIHVQIDTIYDCTFGVQNNILWSYLLACICMGHCFGVHFNDVYGRYTVYSNRNTISHTVLYYM